MCNYNLTFIFQLGRQLKQLSLDQNGTFMSDFDPERSKREMRKLNRKIHKEKYVVVLFLIIKYYSF